MGKTSGCTSCLDVAALAEFLQRVDVVAQPGRLLELQRRAGLLHLRFHFGEQPLLLAFQHQAQRADLLAILLLA